MAAEGDHDGWSAEFALRADRPMAPLTPGVRSLKELTGAELASHHAWPPQLIAQVMETPGGTGFLTHNEVEYSLRTFPFLEF